MVLMHLLATAREELGLGPLGVVHIDHRQRPSSAPMEEALVRKAAAALGLRLHLAQVPVGRRGASEDLLRKERYAIFEGVAGRHGYDLVATGHQADDQAETLLLRLLRGTRPAGLAGIPARRGIFVRPLLGCRRAQIAAYARERGIRWAEDPTNDSVLHARNRIRKRLLPRLVEEHNPRVVDAICRLAESAAWERSYLDERAEESLAQVASKDQEGVWEVDLDGLREVDRALWPRVFQLLTARCGTGDLQTRHVNRLTELARRRDGHQQLALPGGVLVRRVYGRMEIEGAPRSPDPSGDPDGDPPECSGPVLAQALPLWIDGPGEYEGWWGRVAVRQTEGSEGIHEPAEADRDSRPASDLVAYIPVEGGAPGPPWEIRPRKAGDRLAPAGMKGRHRSVKRLLIDRKVPWDRRDRLPLVVGGGRVLWVVGVRRAEGVTAVGSAGPTWRLEFSEAPGAHVWT